MPVLLAQENPGKKAYDIPADDAERALKTFAHQSGLEVLFVTEATQGVRTLAVKGEYTPREALDQLLAGTPLTATQSGPTGAFKVRREKSVELAEKNVASRASRDRAADLDEKKEDVVKLDTFEVFGRKTLNMDIRRSNDDAQPYVVFSNEQIRRTGALSIGDFIRQMVPMAVQISNTVAGSTEIGNVSSISLRGLSSRETLILVDGRRLPGYNFSGQPGQPDLSGISPTAVERIEVLPMGASGTYGGNATGGVINIVLKRNFSGGQLRVMYETFASIDAPLQKVEIMYGATSRDGKTNVMINGSYSEQDELLKGDISYFADARQRVYLSEPAFYTARTIPPLGFTTNIRSSSGNLVLKSNGISLGSSHAFVPLGYAGVVSDGGSAFLDSAGKYNVGLAQTAQPEGALRGARNAPNIASGMVTVRHRVYPRIETYVDLFTANNNGYFRTNFVPLTGYFTIPTSAPSNPFAQQVRIATPVFGGDRPIKSQIQTRRATIGAIMELPRQWKIGIDGSWNQSRFLSIVPSRNLDTAAIGAAIANGTLDLFRDTNKFPVDFSPYITADTRYGPGYATMKGVGLRTGGVVTGFDETPITLSAALEHRNESYDPFPETSSLREGEFLTSESRSQSASGVYLEANIPIFANKYIERRPGRIDVRVSVRADRYTTSQTGRAENQELDGKISQSLDSVDTLFSIRAQLLPAVVLRSSYGTAFLPPNVNQLVPTQGQVITGSTFGAIDRKRGNESLGDNILTFGGGSPQLRPELSTTSAVGLVVTPPAIKGVRISVDWIRTEKRDKVVDAFPNQLWIDREDYLPGLIVRAAPDAQYAVGPIVQFNGGLVNIATGVSSGFDVALDCDLKTATGLFSLSVKGTHITEFSEQVAPNTPSIELSGVAGYSKWKWSGMFGFTSRGWSASWISKYVGSYYLNTQRSAVVGQGGSTVMHQAVHDVICEYELSRVSRILDNMTLTLGIKNVLGAEPPLDVGNRNELVSQYAAIMPRRYMVTITKTF